MLFLAFGALEGFAALLAQFLLPSLSPDWLTMASDSIDQSAALHRATSPPAPLDPDLSPPTITEMKPLLVALLACSQAALFGQDKLPSLTINGETYSNVTITSVTATDIYFSHSGGLGNAKLKRLSPELQARFGFNASKAGLMELSQRDANTRYHQGISNSPPATPTASAPTNASSVDNPEDVVVPQLFARSVRGQRPPQIFVDKWITPTPEVAGKWVLVEFWSTASSPCRNLIPHLNQLQAKFKDRLVIMALSDEPAQTVQNFSEPHIDFSVGIDSEGRTQNALEVTAIPHGILIDPGGIVRFEGMPGYLDEPGLARLLAKYSAPPEH